jgi:hypothetical protein
MRTARIVAALIAAAIGAAAAASAQPGPAEYTVTLHCDARTIPLAQSDVPAIYSWALRFVTSSEESSKGPDWEFPMAEVEQEYSDTLAGDYLRIDFDPLAAIKNRDGIVYARALVQKLDPLSPDWRSKYADHFEDELFTIDQDGAVVGYALYNGYNGAALLRTIGRAIADRGACQRAKGLFLKDAQLPAFLQDFLKRNNLQD